MMFCYSLSTLETTVADFGDFDLFSVRVAEMATIFGDYNLQCGQGFRKPSTSDIRQTPKLMLLTSRYCPQTKVAEVIEINNAHRNDKSWKNPQNSVSIELILLQRQPTTIRPWFI